jgi:hypothetical protein
MPLVGPSPSPQPSADPSPPPTTTPPRRPRPRRPPRPGRRRRPAATGAAAAPRGRGGPGGGGGRGGRPPTTTRSVDPTAAPPPDQAGAARLRAPIYADPLLSSRTVCLSPPVVAGMHNCPCSHGYSDLVQNYFSNYQPNVAHAEIWSAGNRAALESAAISAVRSSKSIRTVGSASHSPAPLFERRRSHCGSRSGLGRAGPQFGRAKGEHLRRRGGVLLLRLVLLGRIPPLLAAGSHPAGRRLDLRGAEK